MTIRQCIPADRPKAQAFLASILGEGAEAGSFPFELRMSLIASDGDVVTGVALYREAAGSRGRELAVAAATNQQPLVQALVDKALTKLHAQGIHKCKVAFLNREEPSLVWQQSRWAGTIAPDETAAALEPAATKKPAKPKKSKAAEAAAA